MIKMNCPSEEKINQPAGFNYRQSLKKRRPLTFFRFFDDILNRPVAALIVKIFYRSTVTPNQITLFSTVIGLVSVFFFLDGRHLYIIIAAILAQISSVVDGADGMLARAKGLCTEYGAMLDIFLDRLVDFCVLTGLTLGYFRQFHSSFLLILGLTGAGLYVLQTYFFYLLSAYKKIKGGGHTGEIRAFMYWLIVIYASLNRMDLAVYTLILETVGSNLYRIGQCLRLKKYEDGLSEKTDNKT